MIFHSLVSGSIRRVVTTLLLIALVPILLVEIAVFILLLRTAQQEEMLVNREVARTLASGFDNYIRDILREELAIGLAFNTLPPADVQQRNRYLIQNAEEYPAIEAFIWVNPQGRIVAAGDSQHIGRNLGDREYIQRVIGGQSWVVSDLLISRLNGEVAFAVARGIRDSQGVLQGIVVGYVDPNRLDEAFAVEREGERAIIFLDRQGVVVYRFPEAPLTWEERRWPDAQSLIKRALAGEETMGTFRSPVDQQLRIAALVPIPSIDWVVMATRPEREVMGPLIRNVLFETGVLLLVAGAALGVAIIVGSHIIVPIERLQQQAQAVGRGELEHRVKADGPDEIRSLAMTFNQMIHELRERERERDIYIHTISHDLRTPLTIALGHTQLIEDTLRETRQDGEMRESVTAITRAMRQMNIMIQDLVDSARIEAGQLRLNVQPTGLHLFIAHLLAQARTAFDVTRIYNDVPIDLPFILTDQERLERILMNLLSNALKYSPAGTPVTIRATATHDQVVMTVTDQGAGIPPEDLPHLFERFYRAKGTRQTEGIGLGLYITRVLVEALGGHIQVESIVDQGTTFRLTLPLEPRIQAE